MLAFITNIDITELSVVVIVAVIVFGKDLPSVVMRGLQQVAKLRKAVFEMWREAGLEQEFKRVKAELDPDIAAARKAIQDTKGISANPVAHWRKTLGKELNDVVEVGSHVKTTESFDGEENSDSVDTMAIEAPKSPEEPDDGKTSQTPSDG